MKYLYQTCMLFGFCLAGVFLSDLLPMPASITAMLLLLAALLFRVVKESQIKNVCDFLLQNMAFFFIPSAVAIIEQADLLRQYIVPFLIICFVTTFIVFCVTAFTVKGIIALQRKWKNR